MYNRILFLMIILTLILGISLCHAESWEQVDKSSWIDVDSIQIEHNGLIKAIARDYLKDNCYYSMTILIDKSKSQFCYERVELYHIDGRSLGIASVDTKEKNSWINFSNNDKVILEIINRAAEK